MIKARELRKGSVIELDGVCWTVEDRRVQRTAQRRPVLHLKIRNMATGHCAERVFDEGEQLEEADVQLRRYQFLYADQLGYVFMDTETFEQTTVSPDLIGERKWLLKEGNEYVLQWVEGQLAGVVFPAHFVDEVVQTAEPSGPGHVMKEAILACGLKLLVPHFIRTGEHIAVEAETRKYLRREAEE